MDCDWIKTVLLAAGTAVAVAGADAGADVTINETRAALEKWVETRQLIARTKADWEADKEMLTQTIQLFDRELQSLQEQRSKLTTNSTQAELERTEAQELLQNSQESLEWVRQFSTGFERELTQLAPRLPAPLQAMVKPLLNRVPSDPGRTRLTAADRVQASVGVLNELDKFNNAVTIFNEKQKNHQGEEVAVDTIYVGLGAAYFVNETGDFAGLGTPGPSGWEWVTKPDLAAPVQEAVRIYRNERSARFIALPVSIR